MSRKHLFGEVGLSIATGRTDGTDWGTGYHDVRIIRDCATGTIGVYYDDMDKPIMRARDETFKTGRFGFGSFDDTGTSTMSSSGAKTNRTGSAQEPGASALK